MDINMYNNCIYHACALEFACILGRNIKCSVIIIIIISIYRWNNKKYKNPVKDVDPKSAQYTRIIELA